MTEVLDVREIRRRLVRARNDARVASHTAWVLRVQALETRLRTAQLAAQNLELVARVRSGD